MDEHQNKVAADRAAAEKKADDERNKNATDQLKADKEKRDAANKQAADVMEKSKPYPTQEQNDMARLGVLSPDDMKPEEKAPAMPPLHEQYKAAEENKPGKPIK
jgi:hypothetical protein